MFNNLFEKEFRFLYKNNSLEITNYIDIPSFNDKKIVVKLNNNLLIIEGINLIISKLSKDELLIKGKICSIGILDE